MFNESYMVDCCTYPRCKEEYRAEFEPRESYSDKKWMLNTSIFEKVCKILKFRTDLECFASRHNTQIPRSVFYKPDLNAYLIDAFSVHCGGY